jgi:glycosyltransferase involved in cell wall biosynthesis
LNSAELILFTNRFPYSGGETFLETEIHFLAGAFEKVIVCPQDQGDEYYGPLPSNVEIIKSDLDDSLRIRDIIKEYGGIILEYYLSALASSVHRFKYFSQFKYTWNTLIGFIRRADRILSQFQRDSKEVAGKRIYYSYWFNEWASALAIARRKGLKGKFVVRAHGYDYDENQNGRGYFLFRESEMGQFDEIVQISEYGAAIMRNKYPGQKNISVSRLGVDDGGFNPGGKEGEVFQIVSCSSFVPLKRITLLTEVLSHLKVPFHWVHFGGGEGMKEAAYMAAEKLEAGTFEFKGYVSNTRVREYYRRVPVDLFLNTSILEGIPVSMMEAIAAGIPVAGFNVCGVPEVVTGETGLLMDAGWDAGRSAEAIQQFLKDRIRNTEFREGVKQFWSERFSAENNYQQFISRIITKQ